MCQVLGQLLCALSPFTFPAFPAKVVGGIGVIGFIFR